MAIAGKVAPTYEGEWSASKTYQQHTYVTYGGNAYISKKPSTGIEPTNGEYWFLALKNISADDITALNNRLDTLSFSETAGGKNLFTGVFINTVIGVNKDYTSINLFDGNIELLKDLIGITYCTLGGYFKKGTYTLSYTNNIWLAINRIAIAGTGYTLTTHVDVRKSYTWTQNVDGYTYFSIECDESESNTTDIPFSVTPNIQIEKGNTATPYEPYIPSIKMLADKTTQIDDLNILGWVVPEEMPIKNYKVGDVFHQRVGRVDLGILDFYHSKWGATETFNYSLYDAKTNPNNDIVGNIYTPKYINDTAGNVFYYKNDKTICLNFNNLRIIDSEYTDITSFKQAMQGVYLYYELAEEKLYNISGNEMSEKISKDFTRYIEIKDDNGEFIGNPRGLIENKWSSLPDGVYFAKILCSSMFSAWIFKIDNGDYGAVEIITYGANNSHRATIINGVFEWTLVAALNDLANYLPLSGGTVGNGSNRNPLSIIGTDDSASLGFKRKGNSLMGYIGMNSVDGDLQIWKNNGTSVYRFLDTSNSTAVAVTADESTPPSTSNYGLWVY